MQCYILDLIRSDKTYQQYATYWGRWENFCNIEGISALQPPIAPVVNFLQNCREEFQLGYSAVNTARSAISMIATCEGGSLSENSELAQYMKGVKNESPHLPRYSEFWDANILLTSSS